MIRENRIDAVLLLRFFRKDLFAIAADFFEAIVPVTNVVELWLGERQNIGSGSDSSSTIVQQLALANGITIKRLPSVDLKKTSRDVRRSLWSGSVQDAFAVAGQFPQRVRPRTGSLRLAWHPGRYLALATTAIGESAEGQRIELDLVEDGQRIPRMAWPDARINRLTFIAGPADSWTTNLSEVPPVQHPDHGIPAAATISSQEGGIDREVDGEKRLI